MKTDRRRELAIKLHPAAWTLETFVIFEVRANEPEYMKDILSGRVIRAASRIALDDACVDEGELGEVYDVVPAEIYDDALAGRLVVCVHLRNGSSVGWVYMHGSHIEEPMPAMTEGPYPMPPEPCRAA